MTTYRPCLGCDARIGCEIKAGVAKSLKGQPVSSLRLKCEIPFKIAFPPGTRVLVGVWDWSEENDPPRTDVPATVVCRSSKKRDKLLMVLDKKIQFASESETEFCTAYPKDVTRLDEPRAPVCEACGRALVHDACGCWEKERDRHDY
jgi:hypothetical protein